MKSSPEELFSVGYARLKAGVKLYTNASLTGEPVDLAEEAIVYAVSRIAVDGGDNDVLEIRYAEEDREVHGFVRASKAESMTEEEVQQKQAELSGIVGEENVFLFNCEFVEKEEIEIEEIYGATVTSSGTCGTNAFWSIDSDGVLTISGSGYTAGYSRGLAPWYYKRKGAVPGHAGP